MNKEEIEKVISEYRRKNLGNSEVYELVRSDLAYGISKEEVDGYVKDYSLSTSQKEIYSKCLRQRYPINFIQFLMKKVEEQRCPMIIEYFEKGMTVEQLEEVLEQKPKTLAALRSMLQNIYSELSRFTDDSVQNPELLQQFQKQINTIVKKFENQEEKISQMFQAIKEHENNSYNEEKEKLLKQLEDVEQDLVNEKTISSDRNVTIINLRNENNELRSKMQSLNEEIQKKDTELQKERKKVKRLSGQVEEAKSTTTDNTVGANQGKSVLHQEKVQGVADAYTVTGIGTEPYVVVRNTVPDEKKSPAVALIKKLFLSKRSNRYLMKKVIQTDLNEGQIRQVASGMEKGLTYEQLDILIESKAAPERMTGIIELAVLENSLKEG